MSTGNSAFRQATTTVTRQRVLNSLWINYEMYVDNITIGLKFNYDITQPDRQTDVFQAGGALV